MTTLYGNVSYDTDALTVSLQGMTTQVGLMNYYADNIAYSDMPGYQRKTPVVTSFAEQLGLRGIDTVTDTSVGRITKTFHPLDLALNSKGYFQKLNANGQVELTRDGRFRMDKQGNLLSDDHMPVLSKDGKPIKMPFVPTNLDQVKVASDGWISMIKPDSGETVKVAQLGIASQTGGPASEVSVRQGSVELSNVFLHEEFVGLTLPHRSFEANRQMFLTSSQNLTRMIQELGRSQ
jgi:flagellar basal-body rod protein FlgF